jgi:Immunity protein 27
MKKLQPDETNLTGDLIVHGTRVEGDETTERIEWLVAHYLQKVALSPESGGWEILYKDPEDGRYWEHTYPKSHMHGGGPPQLLCLSSEEAKRKYKI